MASAFELTIRYGVVYTICAYLSDMFSDNETIYHLCGMKMNEISMKKYGKKVVWIRE